MRRLWRAWFKKTRRKLLPVGLSDERAEGIRQAALLPYHLPLYSVSAVDVALKKAYALGAEDQRKACNSYDH